MGGRGAGARRPIFGFTLIKLNTFFDYFSANESSSSTIPISISYNPSFSLLHSFLLPSKPLPSLLYMQYIPTFSLLRPCLLSLKHPFLLSPTPLPSLLHPLPYIYITPSFSLLHLFRLSPIHPFLPSPTHLPSLYYTPS